MKKLSILFDGNLIREDIKIDDSHNNRELLEFLCERDIIKGNCNMCEVVEISEVLH